METENEKDFIQRTWKPGLDRRDFTNLKNYYFQLPAESGDYGEI